MWIFGLTRRTSFTTGARSEKVSGDSSNKQMIERGKRVFRTGIGQHNPVQFCRQVQQVDIELLNRQFTIEFFSDKFLRSGFDDPGKKNKCLRQQGQATKRETTETRQPPVSLATVCSAAFQYRECSALSFNKIILLEPISLILLF